MNHPQLGVSQPGPFAIGVPFRRGEVQAQTPLAVAGPDGKSLPTQTRALARWEDGSVRWALVSAIAASAGEHTIHAGQTPPSPDAPVVLRSNQNGDAFCLDNGRLALALATRGNSPITSIICEGKPVLGAAGAFRLVVGGASSLHERERKIEVIERGQVRARLRVSGAHFDHAGGRKLHYRLDVELWAGLGVVRLDHQFFNLEPGSTHFPVGRIAVEFDLAMDAAACRRQVLQSHHGEFYEPRELHNPGPVAIVADSVRFATHVEDPAMLLDEETYPPYLDPPLDQTPPWLGVTDGGRSVFLHLWDFAHMRPARLASTGASLTADLWPTRAGTLSLPQGRSRRHTLTLAAAGALASERVGAVVEAPIWEGRATLAPAWLARCGAFEQAHVMERGKSARFEKFLARTTQLEFASDKWDLGDTPDSGYTRSFIAVGPARQPLLPGVAQPPRVFATNGQAATWSHHQDYERAWVNNEYDGIHAIASELMRTGDRARWTTLRWMARHNIEVDFWHHRDEYWLSRISPVHSAYHGNSGGYPSHFWTQGLIEYYCLTGDVDALEVATALGDAILRFFHDPVRSRFYRNFDRENGWALLALVHVYDLTREKRFGDEVERLATFFMTGTQANTANTPRVESASGMALNAALIARFYFLLNLFEAMDLYQAITGRGDIRDWLVRSLSRLPEMMIDNFRQGSTAFSACAALAIAYEHTGDDRFLRAGLARIDELISDDPRWLSPVPEIKPMAITYREFARYLGHAQRRGLLDRYEYAAVREWDRNGN